MLAVVLGREHVFGRAKAAQILGAYTPTLPEHTGFAGRITSEATNGTNNKLCPGRGLTMSASTGEYSRALVLFLCKIYITLSPPSSSNQIISLAFISPGSSPPTASRDPTARPINRNFGMYGSVSLLPQSQILLFALIAFHRAHSTPPVPPPDLPPLLLT